MTTARLQLEAREASFAYGKTPALDRVCLTVEKGERLCLLGANGSGKSTLARLLKGLLVPDRGCVRVGEWDTRDTPPSRIARRVAYVYQNPRRQLFLPTVEEEVAFGPRNLGHSDLEALVTEALELVGLGDRRGEHPYELSEAEMRRLALASVLSMKTDFVILDEPTAALDGPDTERLVRLLEVLSERGCGVLVITHDMEFAAEHFPRAVLLSEGRLLADEPPSALFAREQLPGLRRPVASRTALALGFSPSLTTAPRLAAHLRGVS